MSYDNLENSSDRGRPIDLYRFTLNDKHWYYTSASADVMRALAGATPEAPWHMTAGKSFTESGPIAGTQYGYMTATEYYPAVGSMTLGDDPTAVSVVYEESRSTVFGDYDHLNVGLFVMEAFTSGVFYVSKNGGPEIALEATYMAAPGYKPPYAGIADYRLTDQPAGSPMPFRIAEGDTLTLRLDTGSGGLVLWKAVPISDNGLSQTGESTTDALVVEASSNIEPAQIMMAYPPSNPLILSKFQGHEGDSEIVATYLGEVTDHDSPAPGRSTFTCETFSATMAREGLRMPWQRACPYALYDPLTCKVDRTAWRVSGVVSALTGTVMTIPSLAGSPNDRYSGGFVEWNTADRGIERRGIERQLGAAFTMFGTTEGLEEGMNVTVYRGCARTTDACSSFNNLLNFGGVPALSGKSPFDAQSSVFS